ncbi:MAG: Chorismate synthase [Candidatus Anoxychlamydiales bacterium]|nr:Chorismate synthase [Candidatus Anoxychlamydiales bacterium]
MGSNYFNKLFEISTFGESYSKYIGVLIDGCPSNVKITKKEIEDELKKRWPNNNFSTSRKESDKIEIVSGIYDDTTTGSPIVILIKNEDINLSDQKKNKTLLKPSHANYTYFKKYKNFDYRASSRASGRLTAPLVIASAISKKILKKYKIEIFTYIKSIGTIKANIKNSDLKNIHKSKILCPDAKKEKEMIDLLEKIKKKKDSIGGSIEFIIKNLPVGLGEPLYDKFQARLSSLIFSIPAIKAFEIGDGIDASTKTASSRNDIFIKNNNIITTKTNNEGGVLAGLTNGNDVIARAYVKPTPTIGINQETLDIDGNEKKYIIDNYLRNDTCIAIRAVIVIEAMIANMLVDFLMLNKAAMI